MLLLTRIRRLLTRVRLHRSATTRRPFRCPRQWLGLEVLEARVTPVSVTFHGGPTINNVVIQPIFLGSEWQTANAPQPSWFGEMNPKVTGTDSSPGGTSLLTVANNLTNFLADLVNSPYMDDLEQYTANPRGTIAQTNGIAGEIPSEDFISANLGTSVTDAEIQNVIDAEINSHRVVAPAPNSLYFVFLEPGVIVSDQSDDSGYHSVDGEGNYYAVITYGAQPAGTSNLSDFESMTVTSSHELVESITNPTVGGGGSFVGYIGQPGESSTNQDPNSLYEAWEETVGFHGGWYDQQWVSLRGSLDQAVVLGGRLVEPAYADITADNDAEIADLPQTIAGANNTTDNGVFDGYEVQQYFMNTFVTGSENFYGQGSYTTETDVSAIPPNDTSFSLTGQPVDSDFEVTNIATPTAGPFSGVIGSFYDGRFLATNYTATIDWGDGQTSVDELSAPGDIPGTHNYTLAAGTTVTITIVVQDSEGYSTALTDDVTLANPPLSPTPTIGGVTVSPGTISSAGTDRVTLEATNLSDQEGNLDYVDFYVNTEAQGGSGQAEALLGSASAATNWTWSGYIGGLAPGTYTISAVAANGVDGYEFDSAPATASIVVTQAPDYEPIINRAGPQVQAVTDAAPVLALGTTVDASGDIRVFWTEVPAPSTQYMSEYSLDGELLAGPVQLSTAVAIVQGEHATFVGLPDGSFDEVYSNNGTIEVQKYSGSGTATGGPIIAATGVQFDLYSNLQAAADGSGDLLIGYSDTSGNVYALTLSAAGAVSRVRLARQFGRWRMGDTRQSCPERRRPRSDRLVRQVRTSGRRPPCH